MITTHTIEELIVRVPCYESEFQLTLLCFLIKEVQKQEQDTTQFAAMLESVLLNQQRIQ